MNRLRSGILGSVFSCIIFAAGSPEMWAQDPAEMVKTYISELRKADQDVTARLNACAAAVDAELQAGRLKPQIAESQRKHILDIRRRFDVVDAAGTHVLENEVGAAAPVLNKAWGEFSAALKARYELRSEKLNQTRDAVVQHALELWRKAEREDDLNAPIEVIRAAERALSRVDSSRFFSSVRQTILTPLQDTSRLLAATQRFLAAFAGGNPKLIGESFKQLSLNANSTWAKIVSPIELDQWRQRFIGKATAEVTALQADADALVARAAGSKEIFAVAEKLQPATLRMQALGGRLEALSDSGNGRDFLRGWAKALEKMESGEWEGVQPELDAAGAVPDWLSAAGRKSFYSQLKKADEGRIAAEKTARVATENQVRERLAKVSDGASALVLADELPIDSRKGDNITRERLTALQADLRRIAALWNPQPGVEFSPELLRETGSSHPWQRELRELRGKILREYIARKASSPELLRPPLDALPLEAAIRKLGSALKEKQDWVRLYDLLSNVAPGFNGRDWGQPEEVRGLKAFLTGRNFETAEQFAEAVQSYRTVMSCIGELVPIEATAERIKALKREHPEAFPAAVEVNRASKAVPRAGVRVD